MAKDNSNREEFIEKEVIAEYPVADKTMISMRYVQGSEGTYIDIRKFYRDKNDKWMPTAKGIAIPYDIKDKVAIDMNHFEDLGRIE